MSGLVVLWEMKLSWIGWRSWLAVFCDGKNQGRKKGHP